MRLGVPSLLGSAFFLVLCHLTLHLPHLENGSCFCWRLLLAFGVPETLLLLHCRNHKLVDGDLEQTKPCPVSLRSLDFGLLEELFRYLWSPGVAESCHDMVGRELPSISCLPIKFLSRLCGVRSRITGSENQLEFLDPFALLPQLHGIDIQVSLLEAAEVILRILGVPLRGRLLTGRDLDQYSGGGLD